MTRCVKISHKIIAQDAHRVSLDECAQIVRPFALEQRAPVATSEELRAGIKAHRPCTNCDD